MSEQSNQSSARRSFSRFQETTRQSSAQGPQPLASNPSLNTIDRVRRHDVSFASTSSFGYTSSGPLRVVNTNVDLNPNKSSLTFNRPGSSNESSTTTSISVGVNRVDSSSIQGLVSHSQSDCPPIIITDTTKHMGLPFKKWMSTVRGKNQIPKGSLSVRQERWTLDDFDENESAEPSNHKMNGHRKSSSWSSYSFVGAMKSATASLASLSVPSQSRRSKRNGHQSSNRSSQLAHQRNRDSMDGSQASVQVIDDAAWERALQRRRTLEELISSEESYVSDLKILVNVYFTFIASASSGPLQMSSQTHRNVTEILNLHEEILHQIRRVVPDSEIRSDDAVASFSKSPKISSSNSLENLSSNGDRHALEATLFGRPKRGILLSDPREVTEFAKIFSRLMGRFFIYEEYGANYESTMLEMVSASKTIPNWHIYERSIEALANSLASTSSQATQSKKGLSFEDLLIKPIQRICRYPLLFADLFKYTPVIDGPDSRRELEGVLCGLKGMVEQINRATNDQDTRAKVERSWHLQDLLILPKTSLALTSLRFFGHATLCGVLFVSFQRGTGVRGEYMLCALFKSYLLLALPKQGTTKFAVVAIISLRDTQIDKSDNGGGLQCSTAPYSWKLLFGSGQHLYELVVCACSGREAQQWKSIIFDHCLKETKTYLEEHSPFSTLALDIRPLGYVIGTPGTLTRRLSVQRVATVSSRSNICRVIITNTDALKESCNKENPTSHSISRSQSLPMEDRVLVLAPKRADRMRMESSLADVWTRDLLPYPGMSSNRGEHLIRSSASSMMRKLSRASRTGSLKKRSGSHTGFDFDGIPSYHSESSIANDPHDRPSAYFQSYRRYLSRIYDESLQSSSSLGSPPKTTPTKGFEVCRKKADESGQCSEASVKTEGNGALNPSPSPKADKKGSNLKMKAKSSDAIRGWLA